MYSLQRAEVDSKSISHLNSIIANKAQALLNFYQSLADILLMLLKTVHLRNRMRNGHGGRLTVPFQKATEVEVVLLDVHFQAKNELDYDNFIFSSKSARANMYVGEREIFFGSLQSGTYPATCLVKLRRPSSLYNLNTACKINPYTHHFPCQMQLSITL